MYFRAYQKLFSILLCDDDQGVNEGKGIPVKRARFEDCELLQCTTLLDKNSCEVFEGDIIRVRWGNQTFEDVVGPVPDMFKSRMLHPLHDLLEKHGIEDSMEDLDIEILGNQFESSGKN